MATLTITTKIPGDRRLIVDLPKEFPIDDREYCVTVTPKSDNRDRKGAFRNAAGQLVYFPQRPTDPKLASEHDEFQKQLPELMKRHHGEYIAMHDGKIVAVNKNRNQLLQIVMEQYPSAPVLIRLVTEQPLAVEHVGGARHSIRKISNDSQFQLQ